MTSGHKTLPRRWKSSGLLLTLLLTLAGCDTPQTPAPKTVPPPASRPAEAVAPLEAVRSVCLAWFNTLPTWQDSDAERTKDEIDLSYRTNEAVCAKFMNGAPA